MQRGNTGQRWHQGDACSDWLLRQQRASVPLWTSANRVQIPLYSLGDHPNKSLALLLGRDHRGLSPGGSVSSSSVSGEAAALAATEAAAWTP